MTPASIFYRGLMKRVLVAGAAAPVKLFDRRLYDLFDFGVAASTTDLVAPRAGTQSLKEYFLRLAAEPSGTAGRDLTSPRRWCIFLPA